MALVLGTNCGFVTVAPTTDPQGPEGIQVGHNAWGCKFTSPAGAVKVTEIGWYSNKITTETNFEIAIYDHDSGNNRPDDIIGVSRTNAKGTTVGWKKATGLNITISPNTIYWIGLYVDGSTPVALCDYDSGQGDRIVALASVDTLPDPWVGADLDTTALSAFYAVYETEAVGTNMKINIGDSFKDVSEMKINIGDAWKAVTKVQQNIGDSWKDVF